MAVWIPLAFSWVKLKGYDIDNDSMSSTAISSEDMEHWVLRWLHDGNILSKTGNELMTSLPIFLKKWISLPFFFLGGNANVNRKVIVEAQRVGERHHLSEWGSSIVFVNRMAIVKTLRVSEGDQLGEWGLPPTWRCMLWNTVIARSRLVTD